MRDLLNKAIAKNREKIRYKELPKYPSVLRDISFTVPSEVKAARIDEVFKNKSNKNLKSFSLFDYYPMKNEKSFSYTVEFYDENGTLKDEEVNKLQDDLLNLLNRKLNAQLRKKAESYQQ